MRGCEQDGGSWGLRGEADRAAGASEPGAGRRGEEGVGEGAAAVVGDEIFRAVRLGEGAGERGPVLVADADEAPAVGPLDGAEPVRGGGVAVGRSVRDEGVRRGGPVGDVRAAVEARGVERAGGLDRLAVGGEVAAEAANEDSAAGQGNAAQTVSLVVPPFAHVCLPVWPCAHTRPINSVCFKLAVVFHSFGPLVSPGSLDLIIDPYSFVDRTVLPFHLPNSTP